MMQTVSCVCSLCVIVSTLLSVEAFTTFISPICAPNGKLFQTTITDGTARGRFLYYTSTLSYRYVGGDTGRRSLSLIQTHLGSQSSSQEETTNVQPKKKSKTPKKDDVQKLKETLEAVTQIDNYSQRIYTNNPDPDFRCGYVSLIGAPNMGKSTIMNALLSESLSISCRRPQTTRHAILGVLTTNTASSTMEVEDADTKSNNCQLCFLDTPGILDDTAYALHEGMMDAVKNSLQDSDVLLVVTDIFSTPVPNGEDQLFSKIQQWDSYKSKSIVVAINKVDLTEKFIQKKEREMLDDSEEGNSDEQQSTTELTDLTYHQTITEAVQKWRALLPNAIAIIPLCAQNGSSDLGINALRSLLVGGPDVPRAFRDLGRPIPGMFAQDVRMISNEQAQKLIPLGPPLYEEDALTDRNERFFASEIIRLSLFEKLGKELPYCCQVVIDEFKEPPLQNPSKKKQPIRIKATINVERDSQKGIVVGKGGAKVKEVGIEARKQLEEFLGDKVHLNLNVKVDKDWRSNKTKLKAYGYL